MVPRCWFFIWELFSNFWKNKLIKWFIPSNLYRYRTIYNLIWYKWNKLRGICQWVSKITNETTERHLLWWTTYSRQVYKIVQALILTESLEVVKKVTKKKKKTWPTTFTLNSSTYRKHYTDTNVHILKKASI